MRIMAVMITMMMILPNVMLVLQHFADVDDVGFVRVASVLLGARPQGGTELNFFTTELNFFTTELNFFTTELSFFTTDLISLCIIKIGYVKICWCAQHRCAPPTRVVLVCTAFCVIIKFDYVRECWCAHTGLHQHSCTPRAHRHPQNITVPKLEAHLRFQHTHSGTPRAHPHPRHLQNRNSRHT